MDQCGPFTLEDLDKFSSSIDNLAFSLDDPIWESPNTCIFYVDGTVSGAGQVASAANITRDSQGLISAVGFVESSADRTRTSPAYITASGSVSAVPARIRAQVNADVTGFGNMTSNIDLLKFGAAVVLSGGFVTSSVIRTRTSPASIVLSGNVGASLYKYGEEWVVVADDSNVWTTTTEQTDTWNVVTAANDAWAEAASVANTWTEQGAGSNTWLRQG